jgi:POT family proton-dependent oligopeptide transporter
LVVFIPIFDKLVYPGLRRCDIKFTAITRISWGFFCVSIGMAWSAIVQHLIYITGPNFDYAQKPSHGSQQYNNITVAWQIPAYFFIAISEIFASIAGLEYAFTQAPHSMKSIVMSLFLFTTAVGSALNLALVPVTVDPKLLWMYASLAIEAFVFGILFFFVFRNDRKIRVEEPATK